MRKESRRIPLHERRGFAHADAAAYVGVSPAEFDRLVRTGAMPPPLIVYGEPVWVRAQIDKRLIDVQEAVQHVTTSEPLH